MSDGTLTANIKFAESYVLQNLTFSNDGSGGTQIIDPPVKSAESQGSGAVTIDGVADFEAPTTANVVFRFGRRGHVKTRESFHFNGTISGFGASDTIDFVNVESTAASIRYHENATGTGGALAISNGAQTVELSLLGHYSADNFSIVPDHAKGALVTFVPHHDLVV